MEKKVRILIIGGTRYIGKLLKKKLKKKNFKIFSLSRTTVNDRSHIKCDRNKTKKFYSALKKIKPNIIIDMVNFSKKNSEDMHNAYEKKIISSLRHYIVISSFFVYKFIDIKKFREKKIDLRVNKKNYDTYTRNKIEMEQSLYKSKLFDITTIVRLPYIFSHDDYTERFQKFCELSKNFGTISFVNKNKFSMISKSFAAKCLISLLKKKPQNFVDLANTGNITHTKLIKILRSKFEPKKNMININKKNNLYFVNKDLCIKTKKINLTENIVQALKRESNLYFKSKYINN